MCDLGEVVKENWGRRKNPGGLSRCSCSALQAVREVDIPWTLIKRRANSSAKFAWVPSRLLGKLPSNPGVLSPHPKTPTRPASAMASSKEPLHDARENVLPYQGVSSVHIVLVTPPASALISSKELIGDNLRSRGLAMQGSESSSGTGLSDLLSLIQSPRRGPWCEGDTGCKMLSRLPIELNRPIEPELKADWFVATPRSLFTLVSWGIELSRTPPVGPLLLGPRWVPSSASPLSPPPPSIAGSHLVCFPPLPMFSIPLDSRTISTSD